MSKATIEEQDTAKRLLVAVDVELETVRAAIKSSQSLETILAAGKKTYELVASGVGPCSKCGRRVPSPCDDSEGFHESGPWDFACRDYFYPGAAG